MSVAEKEHKKYSKKASKVTSSKISEKEPVWFNENITKEEISNEEKAELEDLLKEFK